MTKTEAILALREIMIRDRHGYWWVGGGRNATYNQAMDALLGKPAAQEPPRPTARKGPRKPVQVIR